MNTEPLNLRQAAQQIFTRTLAAVDVAAVVRDQVRREGARLLVGDEVCDLDQFARVVVIGIGKACVPMARALEVILANRIDDGLIVTNAVVGGAPRRLPVLLGGHPVPNAASFEAGGRALEILRANNNEQTLVIFLITGGGSAMFEHPIDPQLTLADFQAVNNVLVGCGAVIGEINAVRRRLSAVKGGRLAEAAPRARQISLYLSDVNSDDLTTVASGPTLPDASTTDEFNRIIAKYRLLEYFPAPVAALIASGKIPPLPALAQTERQRRSHHLLLDNRRALVEARRIAERDLDCVVTIASDLIEGDVEMMMQTHIERAVLWQAKHPAGRVCLLSGGEVICPVRGRGEGGRNQEFVLRAAIHLHQLGLTNIAVLSAGTDGIDGNSPAAGAVADAAMIAEANERDILFEEYLQRSDSFNFFDQLGSTIITGPTGNNVRDLRIVLAEAA